MPRKNPRKTTPSVLVGTYRKDQLAKWILPRGLYNYPVREDDSAIREAAPAVSELWLYAGKKDKLRFSASFDREVSAAELADLGYPRGKGKPHAERYLLFRVEPIDEESSRGDAERAEKKPHATSVGTAKAGGPTSPATGGRGTATPRPRVLLRLRDFARSPKRLAELRELLVRREAPAMPPQNVSYLADLPEDLLEDWLGTLFVCEAGKRLTFGDSIVDGYSKKQSVQRKEPKTAKSTVPDCVVDSIAPISAFPESVDEARGLRVYGQMSYETQMAVLSHFLHNGGVAGAGKEAVRQRKEIASCIFSFLERKEALPDSPAGWTDEELLRVAEDGRQGFFSSFFEVPFPDPAEPRFTFIDLFAGMGGFRLAMQAHGGKCVFSSEWNKFAQQTYLANFGEMPFGDITKDITKKYIPREFDILCAGFPCQPFSIAGVSKKKSLGRETGFKDKTQGTLFFDVADIISRHRPKAFFLENVKNLVSHDKGNTFRVIRETLEELDYTLHYRVMDGQAYVPQHRERIMIVGFDRKRFHGAERFDFPELPQEHHAIRDILLPHPDPKYTLTDKLWQYLQDYARHHQEKGNGFGFGLVELDGVSRTLSARYYKDGSEILIPQGRGMNPRRLSPRECARLMGYPDTYDLSAVSDVQAYRQCGNSVIVPLITAVSGQIVNTLLQP